MTPVGERLRATTAALGLSAGLFAGLFAGPLALAADVGAALPVPPFAAYAVTPTFRGAPATVDVASDRRAGRFRTAIRRGAAAGPNFADHDTVVTWGCGSGCQSHAIVDARSGRVVVLPFTTGLGVAFRRDSRLLVADPAERCQEGDLMGPSASRWYVWNGRRLVPIASHRIVPPC